MLKHGTKRVLILREGVLVGVVSRVDVLRAVVDTSKSCLSRPTSAATLDIAGAQRSSISDCAKVPENREQRLQG
jgi:hypothetical protein